MKKYYPIAANITTVFKKHNGFAINWMCDLKLTNSYKNLIIMILLDIIAALLKKYY